MIEGGARAAGRRQPIAGLADPLRGRTTTARREDDNRGFNRKLDHFGPIGGLTHQPTQILHAAARNFCGNYLWRQIIKRCLKQQDNRVNDRIILPEARLDQNRRLVAQSFDIVQ
jgi:hypothetical protein